MPSLRPLLDYLPGPVVSVLRLVRNTVRKGIHRRRYHFSYSRGFYEEGYHELLADAGGDTLESWEAQGYKARLLGVCDALDRYVGFEAHTRYLEIACMYGKTAFWLAERYPKLAVWAFDFSQRFVDATRARNPIGSRLTLWRGDATDINHEGQRFDAFFDFVTCLDVTEHLPDEVYRAMLREIARVTRPGGRLLLMQGNTVQVEHIHILAEEELVADVETVGFRHVATLPDRHHLFERH